MAMHTSQIGPTDTTPLARDRHNEPALRKRGNALGQATFLPPFRDKGRGKECELGGVSECQKYLIELGESGCMLQRRRRGSEYD